MQKTFYARHKCRGLGQVRDWQEGWAGLRVGRLRLAGGLGTQDATELRGTLPFLGPPDLGCRLQRSPAVIHPRSGSLGPESPKHDLRAQLSWVRPLPAAHIRIQLSSVFPLLPGPSLLQWGVGLKRGQGQCPTRAGPHPEAPLAPRPHSPPGPFLSADQ